MVREGWTRGQGGRCDLPLGLMRRLLDDGRGGGRVGEWGRVVMVMGSLC